LKSSGILDEFSNLAAYFARGKTWAAYKRGFDAQNWRFPLEATDRLVELRPGLEVSSSLSFSLWVLILE